MEEKLNGKFWTNDMEKKSNSLIDDLIHRFEKNKYRYLVFPDREMPEGMLVGLSKDTSDYYYIVLKDDLKLKYISVVGKVNFIDYTTEGYHFESFYTINYMFTQDYCHSILRVQKEIEKTIGTDILICEID